MKNARYDIFSAALPPPGYREAFQRLLGALAGKALSQSPEDPPLPLPVDLKIPHGSAPAKECIRRRSTEITKKDSSSSSWMSIEPDNP